MHQLLIKGNPICRVSGILFDKDGTLINSENRLLALARSRKELAKKIFQREECTAAEITRLNYLLSKAYGLRKSSIDPNGPMAIASKKDNLISTATIFCLLGKSWSKSLEMANEIFEQASLQSLNSKDNKRELKLAIISNDSKAGIESFLINNKLEKQFPFFWSSEDNPPKPSPIAIKKLCKLMNSRISECALIGDSDTDLKMAKAAGVAVAIGYTAG